MTGNEEDNLIEVKFAGENQVEQLLNENEDVLESFFEDKDEEVFESLSSTPLADSKLNLDSDANSILEALKTKSDTIQENMKRLKYYLDEMNFNS